MASSEGAVLLEPLGIEDRELRSDWRRTVMAGAIATTLIGGFMILDSLIGRPVALEFRVGYVLFIATLTAWLWTRRANLTRRLCTLAFVSMIIPSLVAFWGEEVALAAERRQGTPWQIFLGLKTLAYCVAVLCPRPRWLPAVIVAACALEAIALWVYLDLGSPAAGVARDEPWSSLTFASVVVVLYCYRVHHERRERELERTCAEATMLRQMNDTFLVVQDMANTPLQNLELVIGTLRRDTPPTDALLQRASRAIDRLRQLRQLVPATTHVSASLDSSLLERARERSSRVLVKDTVSRR